MVEELESTVVKLVCKSCIHLTVLDSGMKTNNVTISRKADMDPIIIPFIIPLYMLRLLMVKDDESSYCEAMDVLLLNDDKLLSDVKLFNVTSEHGHANGSGVSV